MLWLTLWASGIFAITFFLYIIVSLFLRNFDATIKSVIAIIILLVIFFGSYFGLEAICVNCSEETSQTAQYELVSIKDNSQINGTISSGPFYIYTSIGSEELYTYYYKLEDGGYKKGKISALNAVIYEKDDYTPVVLEYTTDVKTNINSTIDILLTFGIFNSSEKSYNIFVPTGTIIQEYYLDAE